MTFVTAEKAVDLAIKVLENNGIVCNTHVIRERVYSWYNNTDVTDPEMLAACALSGVAWNSGATYFDMVRMKNDWFSQSYEEDIAAWEIAEANKDAYYW